MRGSTGRPVEGENFHGRSLELEHAWSVIERGNNLILPSPRRVGKTSFALKLLEKAQEAGWSTISINMEKGDEADFVETFIKELHAPSYLQRMIGNVKLPERVKSVGIGQFKLDFKEEAKRKVHYTRLANAINHDQPTLIFLDELAILLNSMIKEPEGLERCKHLLHWMREVRIKSNSVVRWVYCSSIGVEHFTHHHNLSDSVNDLTSFKLEAFDPETSRSLLRELSEGHNLVLTEELIQATMDKLTYCLPYFLQLMFAKMESLHKIHGQPLELSIVAQAYEELTDGTDLNTWIERINLQYGPLKPYAFAVLKHVCQAPEGVTRQSIFDILMNKVKDEDKAEAVCAELLRILQNDGYLVVSNGKYTFRSPLLRDFWFNRYVQ